MILVQVKKKCKKSEKDLNLILPNLWIFHDFSNDVYTGINEKITICLSLNFLLYILNHYSNIKLQTTLLKGII